MKQVVQHVRSRKLEVLEVPQSRASQGCVVVRNSASLISAGTERMMVDFAQKSLVSKARERPDLVRQVIRRVSQEGLLTTLDAVRQRLSEPLALGYSTAGIVEQVGRGAEEFAVGDRVACAGAGYAVHADVVCVPRNLVVPIPEGISTDDAAYVTLGAIALQGVRIADVRLGDNVAVIGLGLLGQLAVQILKAGGCRVIGIDIDAEKVRHALELGADAAVPRSDAVEAAVRELTGGFGADAVLITAASASNDPIELAGEICRDRGTVVMVGAVKMDVPRKSYYEKELSLRLSRSYGPGRYDPSYEEQGRDYPVGYVRWTERRNMAEFLRLVAAGYVTPSRLTTHRFPLEEAEAAYDLVTGANAEPFLGILLTYPDRTPALGSIPLARSAEPITGKIGLGFIGAGSFGKGVLLPRFKGQSGVDLVGVATATGLSARATGDNFGFRYCSTDSRALLRDPDIDAVVITTRHGSHAALAVEALNAGKSVFVEKPLALDPVGLIEVLRAQADNGGILTVGFNRRFAPLAVRLREEFAGAGPLAITYRINAGPIPSQHWIHDPEQGGGRIIGEVCHFVDLVQFLTDDAPVEVFAYSLGGPSGATQDTISIVLRFAGGSVANINYFATGDKAHPKEHVEIYGGGSIGVLDDFRSAALIRGGKRKEWSSKVQDKGFDREVEAFVSAVAAGGLPPIPIESMGLTTRVTFAIEESLRTGSPVAVGPRLVW